MAKSKLYKAPVKGSGSSMMHCWLVNEKCMAISGYVRGDKEEARICKELEDEFIYLPVELFSFADNPILIAEW